MQIDSFIRPEIRAMTGYVPGMQPTDPRTIKLNTNENPYPPSAAVLRAIEESAGDTLRLYPSPMADPLRAQAARVYGVGADQILAGNGADDLLAMIMRACVGPGKRVAMPVPTYSLYQVLVEIAGGQSLPVPWAVNFSLPDELAACGAEVTILCNPNAPSGTWIDLADVVELSRKVKGLLVVDEAYVDFAEGTAIEVLAQCPNMVVLRTLSKSFSLAGLRVGLAFADAEIISELAKVKDSYNLDRISIAAATAALVDYDWMRTNVERVKGTRERLRVGLIDLGFEALPSHTNFVLARRPGASAAPVFEALAERGILVRYFPTPELYDALRITVGTDREIDTLLTVLGEILGA